MQGVRQVLCMVLGGALLGAALLGCGGTTVQPECDLPAGLDLTVESTDRLNPDPRGQALPTVLRIFQLSNIATAETASFEEMWHEHEELLGDALLGMDELTVYPDRRVRRRFERNPDANYLIAMGLYREPAGQSWRVIFDLPPPPGEQQCAARAEAEADDEEPAELVNPSVELYMDDYRIEGTLRLERADSGCVGLECLAGDAADGATDEAGSAAEGAGQEATESATPDAPSASDVAPKPVGAGSNPDRSATDKPRARRQMACSRRGAASGIFEMCSSGGRE